MASRPNVLIVFTDMQRADTIRALGNPVIRTPSLDRLAAEGTAFENAFSPSPVCVPARCCMHYGLYPQRTRLFDNGKMPPDNGLSYPALLGRAGYRTHAVGKCHFTPDYQALRGFQSRQSQEECTSDPERDDYVAWLRANGYDTYEPHGARGEMYYIPQVSTLPAEAHPSQWVGNESVRFIRESAAAARPWCLFASFVHPHPPFAPPKPWHRLYRPPAMPLPFIPPESASLLTWVNRYQNRYKWRDRGFDVNLVRTIRAYCYATISFVDYQVGRILAALSETGQLDDTLILFTSDHGEYLGDYGCFGKRGMHDASVRIPLLARQPGRFAPGARCATPVSLIDVFPTVLGAAGLGRDGLELDGLDLGAVARGAERGRTVYSQFSYGARAIYMAANEEWKYIRSAGDGREWLFDRRRDPRESRDASGDPGADGVRRMMKADLLAFLKRTGVDDAWIEAGGALDWRPQPAYDESYLAEPDAKVLFQDYPSYPLDLPGYSD